MFISCSSLISMSLLRTGRFPTVTEAGTKGGGVVNRDPAAMAARRIGPGFVREDPEDA